MISKNCFLQMLASRDLLNAPYCPYDFTGHKNITIFPGDD